MRDDVAHTTRIMDEFAVLDNNLAADGRSYLFTKPQGYIRCDNADEFETSLAQLEQAQANGNYLVGFVSYEASNLFNPALSVIANSATQFPYLYFGVFEQRQSISCEELNHFLNSHQSDNQPIIGRVKQNTNEAEYLDALDAIKNHLEMGDTYQVNYTYQNQFQIGGCLVQLYEILRRQQPVEYGAFLNFPKIKVLSRSPELFFKKEDNKLITRPMKGTAARDISDPQNDELIAKDLREDEKTIAENIIIVDLLRNDLGQLADIGTVKAEKLLSLETYKSVHQLTSTISCEIDKKTNFKQIFQALFPCGSVTGAPKARTTKIIAEQENAPRNIYTGAIGMITPDNDMCFSVPIRTVCVDDERQAELGAGGGIVLDSKPQEELEETRIKTRFIFNYDWNVKLIESLFYSPDEQCRNLDEHLDRLEESAIALAYHLDRKALEDEIAIYIKQLSSTVKLRIELSKNGEHALNHVPIEVEAVPAKKKLTLSNERANSKDLALKHKTSSRQFYNRLLSEHETSYNAHDVLFLNERGEVTETTMHNIFIRKNDQVFTPPLECGLLNGIGRTKYLTENANASEQVLTLEDVINADEVFLVSSVRGTVPVEFFPVELIHD